MPATVGTGVADRDLALLEHGLMMPVMLIPMCLRMDVYTGRSGHMMHRTPLRPEVGL
jgi:hypothetical protein